MGFTEDLSEGLLVCVFASLGQYDEKTEPLPGEVCK
jgi:hypothetical protein